MHLFMLDGHLDHGFKHMEIIDGPSGTNHFPVTIGIPVEHVEVIAPMIPTVEGSNALALVYSFSRPRRRLHFNLILRKWNLVWMAETFTMGCLVP